MACTVIVICIHLPPTGPPHFGDVIGGGGGLFALDPPEEVEG